MYFQYFILLRVRSAYDFCFHCSNIQAARAMMDLSRHLESSGVL